MQEVEVRRRWVCSDMRWSKQFKDVKASRHVPSTVVLSFFLQRKDLVLKSPEIVVKRELDDALVFKIFSKFEKNLW